MKEDREMVLAIPFNKVLGFSCPICGGVGIGQNWGNKNTKYCPACGQRIKLVDVESGDWQLLLKDVQKIPQILQSGIVTTAYAGAGDRYIDGVYMDKFRLWQKDKAQCEGQITIFDLEEQ